MDFEQFIRLFFDEQVVFGRMTVDEHSDKKTTQALSSVFMMVYSYVKNKGSHNENGLAERNFETLI